MTRNVLVILRPTEGQQQVIDALRDHLVRERFQRFHPEAICFNPQLSDGIKQMLGSWFHPDCDRVILDRMIFTRLGEEWRCEIRSAESPQRLAEEVLFWLKEEYPPATPVDLSDRWFLSRVLEVYEWSIQQHLIEEEILDQAEAEHLRQPSTEELFKFLENRLHDAGYQQAGRINSAMMGLLIDAIEEYAVLKAQEETGQS